MIQPSRFHEVGWRVIQHTAATRFRTGSLADGFALVQAIGGKVGAGDRPPHLDLRPNGVTVRLVADDRSELTEGDLTLATEITAIARDLNFAANPADVQNVQIAIDTLVMADVLPFWRAVLGYDFVELTGDNLVDPKHIGPTVWFQQMDAPRPQRNRIHVDLYVPQEVAEGRIAAAIEAGGRIVYDGHAPMWWTLADPEGNEVDVAPWPDLDETDEGEA
jgi:4a-hydroxytetrahydrobiopterin dehydratase